VRFRSLLRFASRRGALPKDASDRLLSAFAAASGERLQTSMQFETPNERVYEVTLTPNSRGGWVVVVQDVTAKRNADRVIDQMAHFDSVTNLRNRRSFDLTLTEALDSARAGGDRIDVMFLDLDDFKQVNDSLGHRTGDKVLAEIARRLRAIIGPGDTVARWGAMNSSSSIATGPISQRRLRSPRGSSTRSAAR
jgi:predicted signal transduction protein with EAL and GGDEF domain